MLTQHAAFRKTDACIVHRCDGRARAITVLSCDGCCAKTEGLCGSHEPRVVEWVDRLLENMPKAQYDSNVLTEANANAARRQEYKGGAMFLCAPCERQIARELAATWLHPTQWESEGGSVGAEDAIDVLCTAFGIEYFPNAVPA
jgi:hypothetical protein